MKLFISTGGRGERLYPLTKEIPKPMVPILGKPVLHYLVDWAKFNGIEEIVMMNGFMQEKIVDYFGNGEKFNIKITHSNEPYSLGSGGPLKFARRHIKDTIAYISGDLICKITLDEMLKFHKKKNSQITVAAHESLHPEDSDILDVDENGRIIRFVSKYNDHSNCGNLANVGLSILEPEVVDLAEKDVFNFENYLYPLLLKKRKNFFAYRTCEFVQDIGTFERLKKCEEYLKNNQSRLYKGFSTENKLSCKA